MAVKNAEAVCFVVEVCKYETILSKCSLCALNWAEGLPVFLI